MVSSVIDFVPGILQRRKRLQGSALAISCLLMGMLAGCGRQQRVVCKSRSYFRRWSEWQCRQLADCFDFIEPEHDAGERLRECRGGLDGDVRRQSSDGQRHRRGLRHAHSGTYRRRSADRLHRSGANSAEHDGHNYCERHQQSVAEHDVDACNPPAAYCPHVQPSIVLCDGRGNTAGLCNRIE